MRLYADQPSRRSRQIAGDAAAVALVLVAVWFATGVGAWLSDFAQAGVEVQEAGASFTDIMTDVADQAGRIVLVGDGLAEPFSRAATIGDDVHDAGVVAEEGARTAAAWGPWLVAVPTLLATAATWLLTRGRFVRTRREAVALASTAAGLDALALRALAHVDAASLPDGAARGWREGDPAAVGALARAELARCGVATVRA